MRGKPGLWFENGGLSHPCPPYHRGFNDHAGIRLLRKSEGDAPWHGKSQDVKETLPNGLHQGGRLIGNVQRLPIQTPADCYCPIQLCQFWIKNFHSSYRIDKGTFFKALFSSSNNKDQRWGSLKRSYVSVYTCCRLRACSYPAWNIYWYGSHIGGS